MYYPKSKILENQYTPGAEYQRKDNNEPYIGTYCILSDGKFFSGKTLTNTSIELIKIQKNASKFNFNRFIPNNFINKNTFLNNLNKAKELRPTILSPTPNDYINGFITRYFAKKLNVEGIQIFEISQQDYNDVLNNTNKYLSLYQVISLEWKITGPNYDNNDNPISPTYGVMDTNKRTLEIKEKEMPGIKKYFENRLKEFAK